MQNLQKLNTSEDKFALHKTLGIYCTLHYIFRYLYFIFTGSMNFTTTSVTVLSVLPHFLLPITSFLFHVLPSRKISNLIIWEEMRLHSIIFGSRSIAIFYFYLYNPNINSFIRLLVVLFFHVLADLVTQKYGEKNKSTIRVYQDLTHTDPPVIKIAKLYYSFSQIVATAALIAPGKHTLDTSFSILIGIHYAAFLMTLNRKNIISKRTYNIGYTISLLLVAIVIFCQLGYQFYILCMFLFILRTQLGVDKYIVWGIFGVLGAIRNLRFL